MGTKGLLAYFRRINDGLNARFFGGTSEYQERYKSLIESQLAPARVVLDLGAGSWDVRHYWRRSGNTTVSQVFVIACDLEAENLRRNPNPRKLVTKAEAFPFVAGSIDLIVTENMFEHLQDPVAVLSECGRVLRKRGALVFATPHKLSYIALLAGATPMFFHDWIWKLRGFRREEVDSCETYYRLNTPRAIRRCAETTKLTLKECRILVGAPSYTTFLPPPLHLLFILFHKMIEQFRVARRFLGVSLVGRLEKQ